MIVGKYILLSLTSEKVWNFASASLLIVRGQHRFGRKHVRTFLITLIAKVVVVKKNRHHHYD